MTTAPDIEIDREPDYRFTLANERTFLAWIRTALGLVAGGIVVGRSSGGPYGKRIVIRHQPGFETSYNHLSSQAVSVGDRVTAGQVIAHSGTTGLSTGCHLHFMVLRSGKPVTPQDFL